jgi:MFS transporter, FSR family, fosmidomycin resistance protein
LKEHQIGTGLSRKALYVISLVHATNDSSTSVVPALLPVILLQYNVSFFDIGVLVAAGYLANIIGQPITGRFSERLEPRVLLVTGIAVIAASMVLLIFSSSFALLLGSFILLRAGSSVYHPVGVSAVSRKYPGSLLDTSMGFQSAFGNLGIFVAFLVTAPIYLSLGWKAPFEVFAVFDFAVALITFFMLEDIPRSNAPQEAGKQEPRETRKGFRLDIPILFIVAATISGASFSVIFNYGNILLEHSNFSVASADFLIAIWIGVSFIGAFYTGALTRIFTRYRLITLSYFIASISTFLFALFPSSVALVVACLLLFGLGESITYPAIYAGLAAFLGSKKQRTGTSFGILFSAQIIGSGVMGLLSGYLSEIYGLALPFEIAAALLLLGGVAAIAWRKILVNREDQSP